MTPGGLPHSGIRGSTPADGYPRLIAAFHALLRLVAPRHPPCALNSSAPRNAPCRANRIELNHAHMLLLRFAAHPGIRRVASRLTASGRCTGVRHSVNRPELGNQILSALQPAF